VRARNITWPSLTPGFGLLGSGLQLSPGVLGSGPWQHRRGRRRWRPGADLTDLLSFLLIPFSLDRRSVKRTPAVPRAVPARCSARRRPPPPRLPVCRPCFLLTALLCLSPARSPRRPSSLVRFRQPRQLAAQHARVARVPVYSIALASALCLLDATRWRPPSAAGLSAARPTLLWLR
jgi:hypothetical protein